MLLTDQILFIISSEAIERSTATSNLRKENEARLKKDYVNTLLSTLGPAPLELKIVEKDTTIHTSDQGKITPGLNGIVGAYDEIEGFRIQFKAKKVSKEQEGLEPSTMILRPQIKENSDLVSPGQPLDLNDADAIAANAMETMMMLKNMNLDEVEDSSAQLEMLTSFPQGEAPQVESEKASEKAPAAHLFNDGVNHTSEKDIKADEVAKDSVTGPDKPPESTTKSDENAEKDNDSEQIITIMVPSEVARKVKQAKKIKAKKAKNSNVLQMSFFGKIWTLMDRMVTRMTRSYLRNLEQKDEAAIEAVGDTDDQYHSEDYHLRKHIFSEKVMETYVCCDEHMRFDS